MTETIIGAIGNILIKLLDKLSFRRKEIPRQTLKLVLAPRGAWWHMGTSNGEPAMQVVCEWYVTNITSEPVVITTAFIKKPTTEAALPLTKHPQNDVYGSYRVQPKDTTKLVLDFWVTPPVCKECTVFKGTVIVKDQFNNEHKIKNVEFKYR